MTVKDNGYSARVAFLLAMEPVQMRVGVHGEEGGASHEGGVTVGEIAQAHEYGLGVPRRSFIGSWAAENRGRNLGIIRRSLERVARGETSYPEALHGIGVVFVADCRLRIARGKIAPALSPERIAQKGSTTPLLDTGQLSSSIRYTFRGLGGSSTGISSAVVKGDSPTQAAGSKAHMANKRRTEAARAKADIAKNGFIGPLLPNGKRTAPRPLSEAAARRAAQKAKRKAVRKSWATAGKAVRKDVGKLGKAVQKRVGLGAKRAPRKSATLMGKLRKAAGIGGKRKRSRKK